VKNGKREERKKNGGALSIYEKKVAGFYFSESGGTRGNLFLLIYDR
jgi:hypothetical protein